jgi:AraC-like DNA-binding protein
MRKARSLTQERLRKTGLQRPRTAAFAFPDDLHDVVYDFHRHPYHQLLYSFSGVARLETRESLWLLPPQRAAWIPAGVRHRTTLRHVEAASVYFRPGRFAFPDLKKIAIFTVTPLLREMIGFSRRWKNQPRRGDKLAESVFETMALYCRELAAADLPYSLPRGESPGVRAAIDFSLAHLDGIEIARVAKAASLSVRTLRRLFLAETGLAWRHFMTRARLLRAMELLTGGRHNVTEAACACGFTNLSAFSKAFSLFTGQNPAVFRRNRTRSEEGSTQRRKERTRHED